MNLQKFIDDLFVHGGAMVSVNYIIPMDKEVGVLPSGFTRTSGAIKSMGETSGRVFAEQFVRDFILDRTDELWEEGSVLLGDLEDGVLTLDIGRLV